MRREIYPEVIGIRSRRGGTGKTTYALKLAQEQTLRGKRVCVIDFDILGAGVFPHLGVTHPPRTTIARIKKTLKNGDRKYLEHYYMTANPDTYDQRKLYVPYQGFTIIFNETCQADGRTDFMILVDNEDLYEEIWAKTDILLKKLGADGFDLVIIDCHLGDYFLAGVVAKVADCKHTVLAPGEHIITIDPKPNRKRVSGRA